MTIRLIFLILMIGASACSSPSTQKETAAIPEADPSSTSVLSGPQQGNDSTKTILFFGNSLTFGYGIDQEEAFPALIQNRLDSLGFEYKVINAGLSGETTSTGNSRVNWVLRQRVDIFVLELGGNDGLRGIDTNETRRNLQSIIEKVRAKYPEAQILLAGMLIPPNMGPDYGQAFQAIYPALAEENNIILIPFLLKGVGGEADLNLPDGIHPTPEGHKIVAENVWEVLRTLLE